MNDTGGILGREGLVRTRREFLATGASGLGSLALASLLGRDGVLAGTGDGRWGAHFPARARACIFFFMEGAPSQMDLFDPKPRLNELNGQPLPPSFTDRVRFAFIQKESAVLMGTPRTFRRHGGSGMEFSDLLPHLAGCADDIALVRSMHTEAFNHHPGQLLMNTGSMLGGRPSLGSWLAYGLGSEAENLPAYVVLTAGRGLSGGAQLWSSGFLPSNLSGTRFRSGGDPVLNLSNPPGVGPGLQAETLGAIADLNRIHGRGVGDPAIAARIATYETAFRMQTAAPELMDLSGESRSTLDAYGVERTDPPIRADRGGGPGQFSTFARNCLLARRMVERGVRFVNVYHASWDHHSNLDVELPFNATMADQPIAALLRDLKQRGLLDTTLVVWGSEFGRTPLGENRRGRAANTGRDHHPFAFSMWMAGGGIRGGQVHGETDELGWGITRDPVHVNDLHATLLHLFGLDHERLTYRHQGRDFRLTDVAGSVVRGLLAG